jgi:hypothetical protein
MVVLVDHETMVGYYSSRRRLLSPLLLFNAVSSASSPSLQMLVAAIR